MKTTPGASARVGDADIYARIDEAVTDAAADLVRWRRHLHEHPELSNRESQTAAYLIDQLRKIGVDDIRSGLAGHGIVAIIRGGAVPRVDRRIALRADMDALPIEESTELPYASRVEARSESGQRVPVSHACGHDCHMAVVLAAARVLVTIRDALPGDVLAVFQPAEEGAPLNETGGAQAMLDAGAFQGIEPTMVFGMHVSPLPPGVVGYRAGVQFAASSRVAVTFAGTQAHAAMPWLARDPLLAAAGFITAAASVTRTIEPTYPATVTFGHVEDIGRYNVIGDKVTVHGTLRCHDEGTLADLKAALSAAAEGHATAQGCAVDVRFLQDVPALVNERTWIDAALPTLRRSTPHSLVFEVPPTMGYDDVAVFVREFGGTYLLFGVQDTQLAADPTPKLEASPGGRGMFANHHPGFYADEAALVDSLRIHCHVAIDHLTGLLDAGVTTVGA